MLTKKQIAKAIAKTLLSLSLLATYATKYGLDFSADMSKTVLKAGTNMADYFVPAPKLGVGDALFDKTLAGMDWTLNQMISLQKALKQNM